MAARSWQAVSNALLCWRILSQGVSLRLAVINERSNPLTGTALTNVRVRGLFMGFILYIAPRNEVEKAGWTSLRFAYARQADVTTELGLQNFFQPQFFRIMQRH